MEISDLNEFCSAKGITFERFDSARDKWQEVLNKCSLYPTEYDPFILGYFDVRHTDEQDEYANMSTVIFLDGNAIAVWPLVIKGKEGARVLGSNGGDLIAPLHIDSISSKVLKKLNAACFEVVQGLGARLRISQLKTRVFNFGGGASDWHRLWLAEGACNEPQFMLYVDLDQSLESIKSNFRKSYRPLVTKGLRQWQVELISAENDETFAEFKALHVHESGRQTRSDGTWQAQYQAIKDGSAFLVALRESDGKFVGGGLFYFNRTMALYAVGAYERALFKEPLGHVVQYKAMEYLLSQNVKLYCIGHRPYAQDALEPTTKEMSIGQFKEGFATDMYTNFNLTLANEL